jgi:peptidoglycan/xylan/chitin deacetylase (PgdA/CDA1 family)
MEIRHRLFKWLAPLLFLGVAVFLLGSDGLRFAHASHVSGGKGCGTVVALTFDDGPDPPYTQQVLDILEQNDARATFFVEGQGAEAHPETVKLLRDAGMAIGSHSYTHSQDLVAMSARDFRRDLESAEAVLVRILGQKPQLFRAPFGHTSATMLKELRKAGYVSIGWDVDSTDWRETDPEKIAAQVLSQAHPGAIVLMHDGGLAGGNPDRSGTVAALPAIISGLRERGYEPVTVPDILDPQVCSATLP